MQARVVNVEGRSVLKAGSRILGSEPWSSAVRTSSGVAFPLQRDGSPDRSIAMETNHHGGTNSKADEFIVL